MSWYLSVPHKLPTIDTTIVSSRRGEGGPSMPLGDHAWLIVSLVNLKEIEQPMGSKTCVLLEAIDGNEEHKAVLVMDRDTATRLGEDLTRIAGE